MIDWRTQTDRYAVFIKQFLHLEIVSFQLDEGDEVRRLIIGLVIYVPTLSRPTASLTCNYLWDVFALQICHIRPQIDVYLLFFPLKYS